MEERDYVLGTHDAEIERLGLQHRVWRPRALDAWRRAGVTVGQTVLDVGCGPGYAALDLAEIAGASGRVIGIDRSARFLEFARLQAADRRLNLSTIEADLDDVELPPHSADAAWVRWVFAFVREPRGLVERIRSALKPRGTLVIHEYFDYRTWRVTPRLPEFEAFVTAVMESWRASGGEPDVALDLPRWLEESGFVIRELRPIVDVITPRNFVWQWPKAFLEIGLQRLVDLGRYEQDRASQLLARFSDLETTPHLLMVTPAVLEIIASQA